MLNLRLDHKREAEAAEESVSRSTRNSSSDGPLSESVHQVRANRPSGGLIANHIAENPIAVNFVSFILLFFGRTQ